MIDYKALKGDPTDNIPGVPGVGEKTAAKLIREFGTLEALYERIDEVKPDKLRDKLVEHREQVFMGKDLSTIVRDLPVEFDLEAARLGDYDRETVIRLFREYEFRSLIERLPAMTGETAGDAAEALRGVATDGSVPAARVAGLGPAVGLGFGPAGASRRRRAAGSSCRSISMPSRGPAAVDGRRRTSDAGATPAPPAAGVEPGDLPTALAAAIADPSRIEVHAGDRIAALEPWLAAQPAVGIGLLLDDPRPRRGSPLALAVAGLGRPDGRGRGAGRRRGAAPAPRAARRRRSSGTRSSRCSSLGIADDPDAPPTPVAFDTQIAAYVLNAALRSQTIADVVAEQLDLILPPVAELDSAGARRARGAVRASPSASRSSAASSRRASTACTRELELPLIAVLARMEATGVALDLDALRRPGRRVRRRDLAARGRDLRRRRARVQPRQPQAARADPVLRAEPARRASGRRPATRPTRRCSRTCAPAHPMIDKLLEWRIYTKLRSTYVDALPTLMAADGRLHTTFHQAVAATGRLSSSDPNLQNIPIRTPLGRRIRRAFVAGAPDLTLVAADYSQIELRILAHVSGDEHLRDAFARGADLHRETAALVLHKDPAEVTLGERSMAKMVNFGIAYGLSDFGLSERANIPRAEAQAFINTYFATYSGISYYMLAIKEQARTQGYVTTLLGRKRQIPELAARNPTLRAAGERMAINMPIQGTAADIVKIAMIRLDERLRAGGFRARPLLQVHDELLLEVPRDEVDRLVPVLRETMESALPLDVPLTVDIKVGDDWESMTPLTRADAIAAEADEAPDLEAPVAPTLG